MVVAFAQQQPAPSAPPQPQAVVLPQEPAPATNDANEAIILEQMTLRRDWQAKAIALHAYSDALVKQNGDLRSKLAETEKKATDAAAEVTELKGRIEGLEKQKAPPPIIVRPQMTPMPKEEPKQP